MKKRTLSRYIRRYAKEYPIIGLVGPRQSGKTTLAKHLFPKHKYISLESIDLRKQAIEDPRGFFEDYGNKLIIDEVQRAPDLFSYLQELVDEDPTPGQYILTGSHQFLLFEGISQSLAGRISIFKLFPFTYTELEEYPDNHDFKTLFRKIYKNRKTVSLQTLYKHLFKGFYPRIHDRKLDSRKWAENYISTYIERDVRSLINIKDIRTFEVFIQLCASLSGQLVNYSTLSNHVGVSQPTIKQWLSILETSGIVFLLPPYYKNFSKRIIKTPKLYFIDTGLLCYLLGIRSSNELAGHPLVGSIFETFFVSECYKRISHLGEIPPLYFWKNKMGKEVDLIIDDPFAPYPMEIKSAQTPNTAFTETLKSWFEMQKLTEGKGAVIYTGKETVGTSSRFPHIPWYRL
ncbi:MAG: ATP-binding protein [Chlamydiales bacterium]|nr:ATP-binding protein [Chlamydiales bacterium]